MESDLFTFSHTREKLPFFFFDFFVVVVLKGAADARVAAEEAADGLNGT